MDDIQRQIDECLPLLTAKFSSDGVTTTEFAATMADRGWSHAQSDKFIRAACQRGLMKCVGTKSIMTRAGAFRRAPAYAFNLPKKSGKRKLIQ